MQVLCKFVSHSLSPDSEYHVARGSASFATACSSIQTTVRRDFSAAHILAAVLEEHRALYEYSLAGNSSDTFSSGRWAYPLETLILLQMHFQRTPLVANLRFSF